MDPRERDVRHVDVAGRHAVYGVHPQPVHDQCRSLLRHHPSLPVRHQAHASSHARNDHVRVGVSGARQHPAPDGLEEGTRAARPVHREHVALLPTLCNDRCLLHPSHRHDRHLLAHLPRVVTHRPPGGQVDDPERRSPVGSFQLA